MRSERIFPAEREETRAARHFTRDMLGRSCARRDDCELLISELFTNAVTHSASKEIQVTLIQEGGIVRGEVRDQGGASDPQPSQQTQDEMDFLEEVSELDDVDFSLLAEDGRGLALVEQYSAGKWGVDHDEDSRTVWFELDGCACQTSALAST